MNTDDERHRPAGILARTADAVCQVNGAKTILAAK
jgi:hypothetical protein